MKRLLASLVTLALLVGGAGLNATTTASAGSDNTVGFGMDAESVRSQSGAGVKPDYGTFWVGPWTLKSGWGDPSNHMSNMRSQGVTPVIHFYYWGDDISQSCVQHGCWSGLHNTHKDQAGWQRLAQQLVDNLHKHMGGKKVVVVMETEFNKGDMQTYKPFDYQLRDKANFIKWNYPNAEIVLGLGNWNRGSWSTWTSSAGASDYIGIQAMRGSTRDSLWEYQRAYDETLNGAKDAKSKFGKPVFITDVALSSHWEPEYLGHQRDNLKKFFDNLDKLKGAGVQAMLYRTWLDQPDMNLGNYYGQAERHWGLAYSGSGSWKPAASVWVDGVKSERSSGGGSGSGGGYNADFRISSGVNEWWIDVKVDANPDPAKVHAKVNGGSWTKLDSTSWGTWAKSIHAPAGSKVEFRATAPDGSRAYSGAFNWLQGGSGSGSDYSASFKPASGSNDWWIDVKVDSSPNPAKVHAKVNGGSWTKLDSTSWGTWAKSIHAPAGSKVEFRATAPDGSRAYSEAFTWLGFAAKFTPKQQGNDWWVEVDVKSSENIQRVDACIKGDCKKLSKQSWGSWARSFHVPDGSQVKFVATSTAGDKATSSTYTWW